MSIWNSIYYNFMQNGMAKPKRVFIIHGWGALPENGWYQGVAADLRKQGFDAQVPAMPNTQDPKPQEWIAKLNDVVGTPTTDDYFIGHSLGPTAIMLWLEQLPKDAKIGGALFVGGGFTYRPENMPDDLSQDPWYHRLPDFKAIKPHCDRFVALVSDDDPIIVVADKDIFANELGAEIVLEQGYGHYVYAKDAPRIVKAFSRVV